MVLWLIAFGVLTCLFYLFRYSGDFITEWMYEAGAYGMLHGLTGPGEVRSLPFYTGAIRDILWGPLSSLCGGLAFLVVSWKLLRRSRPAVFGMAVFAYILLTRPEVLFFPPYGEAAAAHFSDAIWLVRGGFDYSGFFRAASFAEGGPIHYATSIYPSVLAGMMAITPGATSFLCIVHLAVFAMGAAAIALTRELVRYWASPQTALLTALGLLALPLFQSMVELINMEMPCLLFALLAVHFTARKKWGAACLFAGLCVLIKLPGAIACVFVFVMACFYLLKEPPGRKRYWPVIWGALALALAVGKSLLRRALMGSQPAHNRVEFLIGTREVGAMFITWTFLLCTGMFVARAIFLARKNRMSLSGFFVQHAVSCMFFLLAGLWFLMYLNFSVMGPRYKLLIAPFLLGCVISVLKIWGVGERTMNVLLSAFIVLAFLGSHGLFYKKPVYSSNISYNRLERSLEYRNDLNLHRKAASLVERQFGDYTVGVPSVMAHMFAFPQLGYVDRELDILVYGRKFSGQMLDHFQGLSELNIRKTVWLGFRGDRILANVPYPIDPRDKIIKTVWSGNKRVTVFQGGFGIERMWKIFLIMTMRQKLRGERSRGEAREWSR